MEINNNNFLSEEMSIDLLESHDDHGGTSAGNINFLLLIYLGSKGYKLYSTLDDDDDNSYEKSSEIRFQELRMNPNNPYNNKDYYVVGSCNGLICMALDVESDNSDEGCKQPIYITNPTTREWLTIPTSIINRSHLMNDNGYSVNGIIVVYGFGYLPSTNEYKVVRIYYYWQGRSRVGRVQVYTRRVQVYTLGDGIGWRDKGEITYDVQHNHPLPSVLANGALHWLDKARENVVAFDLADEEFSLIPSPPSCFLLDNEEEYWRFQIKVLGGQLCAVFHKNHLTFSVWVLKNNKEKNGNGQGKYQFWSWVKEFDIETTDLKVGHLTPFILTKQGDVLSHNHNSLYCHELKNATAKQHVDMQKCLPDFYWLESIIPHLNSFISLKALGEEDTEII